MPKYDKYIILLFAFALFSINNLHAQRNKSSIDSLKQIINSYVHDSVKINAYFQWDNIIYAEDPETDFVLNDKIEHLSKANISRLAGASTNSYEWIFFQTSLSRAYNNKGLYYIEKNKPFEALEAFDKGYKIASEYNFLELQSSFTNNLGLIYDFLEDHTKALEYYLKSLEFEHDSLYSAPALNNIGLCYTKLNNIEKAIEYYNKSIYYSLASGNIKNLGNTFSNLADIYKTQNNIDSALHYYTKALTACNQIGNQQGIAYVHNNLGELFLNNKNIDNALHYCFSSFKISEQHELVSLLSSSCKCLYKTYKTINKKDSTLFYLEKYVEASEIYLQEKNNNELLKKQFQFEFDAKQELAQKEHKKEIELLEEKQKRQNAISLFFILGTIGLAVFLIVIYKSLKEYKRQNKIIEEQKQIVETKQKEILDSIQYAKRIQLSILTSELYIERNLKRLLKK
jgi:tetratricopeptide (TPR) repeat protein